MRTLRATYTLLFLFRYLDMSCNMKYEYENVYVIRSENVHLICNVKMDITCYIYIFVFTFHITYDILDTGTYVI